MDGRNPDRPEKPRSEPEIIPPGRGDALWTDDQRAGRQRSDFFIAFNEDGHTRYATFKPPGPFAIWLVLIIIGLAGAAVLMLALGFVLFLVPVVVILAAALVLSARVRAWWRRLGDNDRQ